MAKNKVRMKWAARMKATPVTTSRIGDVPVPPKDPFKSKGVTPDGKYVRTAYALDGKPDRRKEHDHEAVTPTFELTYERPKEV